VSSDVLPLLLEPLLLEPLLPEPLLLEPLLLEPLLPEPLLPEPLLQELFIQELLSQEPLSQEPLSQAPPFKLQLKLGIVMEGFTLEPLRPFKMLLISSEFEQLLLVPPLLLQFVVMQFFAAVMFLHCKDAVFPLIGIAIACTDMDNTATETAEINRNFFILVPPLNLKLKQLQKYFAYVM